VCIVIGSKRQPKHALAMRGAHDHAVAAHSTRGLCAAA
jgi:hypothetical protein